MSGSLPEEIPLFDAGGALSREHLLHRGYCCENGCRNCPYGFRPQQSPAAGRQPASGSEEPEGGPGAGEQWTVASPGADDPVARDGTR
jgi:hypothetical protein